MRRSLFDVIFCREEFQGLYKPYWDDLLLSWYEYDRCILEFVVLFYSDKNNKKFDYLQRVIGEKLKLILKETGTRLDGSSVRSLKTALYKRDREFLSKIIDLEEIHKLTAKIKGTLVDFRELDDKTLVSISPVYKTLSKYLVEALKFFLAYDSLWISSETHDFIRTIKEWIDLLSKNDTKQVEKWEEDLRKFPVPRGIDCLRD